MFCVVSIGNKKMSYDIFSKAADYFCAVLFDGKRILSKGFGKKLFMISSNNTIATKMPCIYVFSHDFNGRMDCIGENSISIVSSENKNLLYKLSKTKTKVVTCGMCAKDTVTCTSINENSAVIAIQRSLDDVYGKRHMPFETPIVISDNPQIYNYMAYTALLTILGIYN